MLKIAIVKDFKHKQIEFPDDLPTPKKNLRGGRGTSLHLARNVYRDVTEEELEFIERTRPSVFKALKIRRDNGVVSRRTQRKLEAAAAAQKALAEAAAKTKADEAKPKARAKAKPKAKASGK